VPQWGKPFCESRKQRNFLVFQRVIFGPRAKFSLLAYSSKLWNNTSCKNQLYMLFKLINTSFIRMMYVRENRHRARLLGNPHHIHAENWNSVAHSALDLTVVLLTLLCPLNTAVIVVKTLQL
jgi:hypothetical protein